MDFTPVNDFFSNIKDKLTNPFFGTLIFVWLIRNWILVYTFFNFDSQKTLDEKIAIIKDHLKAKDFLIDLGICAWHALLFMIAGYIIIMITRGISMYVEHNAMPWITKKVISKNYVLKEEYDIASDERDDYFKKYEEERKKVRESSKDYTTQLALNEELKSNLAKTDEVNKELRTSITSLKENTDKITNDKEKLAEKVNQLTKENKSQSNSITTLQNSVNQALNIGNIDIINTELNNLLWQAMHIIFKSSPDFQEAFLKTQETTGVLTFDRQNFNMQAYSQLVYQILGYFQSSNLGNITTSYNDKLMEFYLNENGLKFMILLKFLANFKQNLNFF